VGGGLDLWELTVQPAGEEPVEVFALEVINCSDRGAPCDAHGIGLSYSPGASISGPADQTLEQTQEESNEPQFQQSQSVSPELTSVVSPPSSGTEQQQPVQSRPPAPTNLTATVNSDGSITLSWDAPDDDTVTGYQILRRRPWEGEGSMLVIVEDTGSTSTTFTDTNVTAGTRHTYRVKAINQAGLSGWSNYFKTDP